MAAPCCGVRVAPSVAVEPRVAGRGDAGAAGRRLPRADEALRGGPPRAPAAEIAAEITDPPKGEITLVIGGVPVAEGDEGEALAALSELVEAGAGRRQAADVVSRLTGLPRNRLYRSSL